MRHESLQYNGDSLEEPLKSMATQCNISVLDYYIK